MVLETTRLTHVCAYITAQNAVPIAEMWIRSEMPYPVLAPREEQWATMGYNGVTGWAEGLLIISCNEKN